MKRACCHPRAKPGFWALIEIVVVVAIILVAFTFYWGLSGSRNSAVERELLDPTGTTVAIDLQKQLEAGGGSSSAPIGRPAPVENTRPGPDGQPANQAGGETNPTPVPDVRQPGSIPGRAVYKARGEQCSANLRQLRMMIQMTTDDRGGTFPASITDVPDSIKVRSCPVGGQDYGYDPNTGRTYCTTPGHEGF